MSHDVAQHDSKCVRAGSWPLAALLVMTALGCDPRMFDGVTSHASTNPTHGDAGAPPAPRDAGRDAGLDAQLVRDGAARDARGNQPALEPDATRDQTSPSADASTDAAIFVPDAAVERDLCSQVLPAAPSLSGIVESSVKILPPIAQNAAVTPRGPGTTARFGARVLWMFGTTFVRNMGFAVAAANSATLSNFDRPFELDEARPDAPPPTTFIPELAADMSNGADTGWLSFVMGSVIASGPAEALVFYSPSRLTTQNDAPVDVSLGTRVARIETDLTNTYAVTQPELLFPPGAPSFRSGFVARDNYVYLYGCPQVQNALFDCYLARAPLAQATSARAYQYRTAGGWSNDLSAAIVVITNARPELSVSWNPYLRRYLAVYFVWITNQIALQTAERPEGPFSPFGTVTVPEHEAGPNFFLTAALEHAELAGKCGKKLLLTYLNPVKVGESTSFELRPVELELR